MICMCDTPEASSFVQLSPNPPHVSKRILPCVRVGHGVHLQHCLLCPTSVCTIVKLCNKDRVHGTVSCKDCTVKISPPGTLGCKMCTGLTKLSLSRCRFMLCIGNVYGTYSVVRSS